MSMFPRCTCGAFDECANNPLLCPNFLDNNLPDCIADAIYEASEQWHSEYDSCRAILTELVELKNIKDTHGKTAEYERRQPIAWETAKEFLKKYQHL